MKSTTPTLKIARPQSGQFASWFDARNVAHGANIQRGRGHRAIKCQDGTFAVIFRPAVAGNKQRRVRVTF